MRLPIRRTRCTAACEIGAQQHTNGAWNVANRHLFRRLLQAHFLELDKLGAARLWMQSTCCEASDVNGAGITITFARARSLTDSRRTLFNGQKRSTDNLLIDFETALIARVGRNGYERLDIRHSRHNAL